MVSRTVTVNDAVPAFPYASVAVQVTGVVASGKVAPLAGVQLTATGPSTASVAAALKLYAAPLALVASSVAFAGTVTPGAAVSRTVTVKAALPVFPDASVAVQVTGVGPSGKIAPLAGLQVGVRLPATASVAAALKL